MVFTRTIRILVAVLIVMLPVGLFIMLSGNEWRQYLWTANIFLVLQAAVTFIFLVNSAEKKSALFTAITVLVLAFAIELTGLKTGFPFGKYTYSEILKPSVFGVPLAISLSWFSVSVNSYFTSRFLTEESKIFYRLLVSALLILGIDILLEPFASFNGFWTWADSRVPLQNYLSWFIAGFVFSLLLERLVIWNRNIFQNMNFITIPAVILTVNIIQFAVINLYGGFYISAAAGLIIISACILLSLKFRMNEE